MGIVLTEKAANEVKRIIADQKIEPEMVLRVGVTGGGCSGFSYALGFDKAFDEKISLISLQILKELALNGYAMTFFDVMLCNSLVRIINQSSENPLYTVALEVIKAVAETSNYSIL